LHDNEYANASWICDECHLYFYNLGGYCSDASASVQSLHSIEKKAIQANYRKALHSQQQINNDIQHERELIEIKKGFDTSSVPYMRSK
jgi:hypothetical protein